MKSACTRVYGKEFVFFYEDCKDIMDPVGEPLSIASEMHQIFMANLKVSENGGEVLYTHYSFKMCMELIESKYLSDMSEEGLKRLYYVGDIDQFPIIMRDFVEAAGIIVEAMNFKSLSRFLRLYVFFATTDDTKADKVSKVRFAADRIAGIRLQELD